MEGVGSVQTPLSQGLHQHGASKSLRQQADDWLEARSMNVTPGLSMRI